MRLRAISSAMLLGALACLPAAACELSVRWSDDPPYAYRDKAGQITGIDVDFAVEALQRMGCKARLVELVWARALVDLRDGRLDALPGTLRRPEREAYAWFAQPRGSNRNVLFARVEAIKRWPALKHLKDLPDSGFRLGAEIGASYAPEFKQLLEHPRFGPTVQMVSTRHSLIHMARLGRIDGYVVDERLGLYELKNENLEEQIRPTAVIASTESDMVAFSRKTVNKDLVERFDAATAALVREGRYTAILKRHGALAR
ncbi:transporter substrate-binding domain-containing protein [Pelomonas sp. SE-A7]|uniref:substrate-binding periplasmic protein n=1 Tax=Pelomonas sp. SE-A7 TaxID=3054953 RepID=UPI00259CAE14|nr:transporter substrate-binding domain-containing protein [Pelomonas sp. SE-A7]MDM4767343.1 transporter substrate-binding domain-containing protein [Pelomonas sp. SE-A7]